MSEGKIALSNKLRKVESLTLQNRLHAAGKVLFSHGIAPASDALFERLQKLHPPLKEPIPDLGTSEKQFTISPTNTAKVCSSYVQSTGVHPTHMAGTLPCCTLYATPLTPQVNPFSRSIPLLFRTL